MNYYFNVLWYEDNTTWYKSAKIQIQRMINKHNLICKINWKRNSELDINALTDNKYDLILIDYDLKTDKNGNIIIKEIRDNNILTDILFYSSEYDNMLKSISKLSPPLDGIYYSNRKNEEIYSKLDKLISKIVCKAEDLINLRGFVLDNTCDFENRIKEILNICWEKLPPETKQSLELKLNDVLESKTSHLNKNIAKARAATDIFTYSNNDKYLLNSSDRLDLINCLMTILREQYNFEYSITDFKSYYTENVGVYRNKLSHIKSGDNIIYAFGKRIPINQSFHRQMRKNIAECENNITIIEEFITESF